MSPLELPGKPFGRIPDGRNIFCARCGRPFREFRIASKDKCETTDSRIACIICPHCEYVIKILKTKFELVEDTDSQQEHPAVH